MDLSYAKLDTNAFYVEVNQISKLYSIYFCIFLNFYNISTYLRPYVLKVHIYTMFRYFFYCEFPIDEEIYNKFKKTIDKNNGFKFLVQLSEM